MKKPTRLVPLILFPLIGTLRAGDVVTGSHSASSTALVTISLPSFHGIDVSSGAGPASAARLAVSRRATAESVPLSLIGTNAGGTWRVVRIVSPAPGTSTAFVSARPASDPRAVEVLSRHGASGWVNLEDRVPVPATSPVLRSGEPVRPTVVYEVWHF
jgi:hypothetical protein